MISKTIAEKISYYINIPSDSIMWNEKELDTDINDKNKNAVINLLTNKSKQLQGVSSEVEAEIYQWIEFAILYITPVLKDRTLLLSLLKNIDSHLMNRSYLAGQISTLADVINFYALFDVVKSLTPPEKEKLINLCRWFDHLQLQNEINQQNELVNFTVLHL